MIANHVEWLGDESCLPLLWLMSFVGSVSVLSVFKCLFKMVCKCWDSSRFKAAFQTSSLNDVARTYCASLAHLPDLSS
eukprot:3882444-Amphidinium_carterae.1